MLDELNRAFDTQYTRDGDKLILDNYVLAPGDYLYIHNDGKIEHCRVNSKSVKELKVNPDEIVTISNPGLIRGLKEKDYYSRLLSMNKPIDKKKQIHSNNYLSFWVKQKALKDNQGNSKITDEIIDNYYATLRDPETKYESKKNTLELYRKYKDTHEPIDGYKIDRSEKWIKDNLFQLDKVLEEQNIKLANDNSYLKIFFEAGDDEYRREGERYFVPNVYNSNDYNIEVGDQVYGVPDNNNDMNAKKPFLFNRSRPTTAPFLLDEDRVIRQKKLFDYLMGLGGARKNNLYIDREGIHPYKNGELPKSRFNGYFARIQKGKEIEIHDFDLIPAYDPHISGFNLTQVIPLPEKIESKLVFDEKDELYQIQELLSSYFFRKYLTTNYFTDPGDIRLNDFRIKEELIKLRQPAFNWFYKGDSRQFERLYEASFLNLIKNSIFNGNRIRAIEQFYIRAALQAYFNGGDVMLIKQEAQNTYQELWDLVNEDKPEKVINERMYYFAVGQLASFFLSKNKTANKTYSLSNPILNAQNDRQIKDQLNRLFIKYNYDIKPNRRLANMMAMVLDCEPEYGKVNQDYILIGYLYPNIIYRKAEKQEAVEGENNEQA